MVSKIAKSTAFILVFALLFAVFQSVLTPSFHYNQNVDYSIKSFDNFERNSIDVVFLGQSQALLCVSPMKLYEDTQVRSYNLATSGQPIQLSYYLCKHILKRQSPKVVVLNAGNLFYSTVAFENWRFVMDNMPLDMEKIEMAKDFASWPGSDGFWCAVFPLLRFHTRWDELTRDDMQRWAPEYYYTAGQYLINFRVPNILDEESMNAAAKGMEERNTATVHNFDAGGAYLKAL